MDKTYSFVIPHHNTPDLLQRLVDSIPQREDIEIIVVDDNSDAEKKAAVKRQDVKTIFIDKEHSRGAGRARNVGLKYVTGKWILFADSDDFYDSSLESCLNVANDNTDADIIYFKVRGVNSDTLESIRRGTEYNNYVEFYLNGGFKAEDRIRFFHRVPWGKIYRTSFIKEGNYVFEETPTGNDMMFCCKTGAFAKKILVSDKILYVVTSREGSLTKRLDRIACRSRFEVKVRQNKFVKSVGKSYCALPLMKHLRIAWKYFGFFELFYYFIILLKKRVNPLTARRYRYYFSNR